MSPKMSLPNAQFRMPKMAAIRMAPPNPFTLKPGKMAEVTQKDTVNISHERRIDIENSLPANRWRVDSSSSWRLGRQDKSLNIASSSNSLTEILGWIGQIENLWATQFG